MAKSGLCPLLTGLALGGLTAAAPLSASPPVTPADSPFIIETWGVKDGLPQSSVISVIQARDGYLWLGTLAGLVRFDGVHFAVFDENNTPGLKSSRIVYLFEDSQTNLWVGTEDAGVALVRGGKVRELDQERGGSRDGRLIAACEDSRGAVWLYAANGHLYRHLAGEVSVWKEGAGWTSQFRTIAAEEGRVWVGWDRPFPDLGNQSVLTAIGPITAVESLNELPRELVLPVGKLDLLVSSAKGGYWRLANGRIQKCRGNSLADGIDTFPYPWRNKARPTAACEDHDGNLIVGTQDETSGDGVFWFGASGTPTRIAVTNGLSHNGILSLCMDREGSLWVGTDGGGLNRVKRKRFHLGPTSQERVAQTVCADGDGGVWMGFTDGATFCKGATVRQFGPNQGLQNKFEQNVSAVFVDRQKQVWVGTGGGLFRQNRERLEPVSGPPPLFKGVTAIHEDQQGRLWFGTQAGLVSRSPSGWAEYSTSNGLTSDIVRALADDAGGRLWIGTEDGGLNCLREGRFEAFRKGDTALPSDRITALLVDGANLLWVGTAGGLARFDGRRWTRFTTSEGLLSNSIGYLLDDGEGDLWLGSNAGLMRVKKRTLEDFAPSQPAAIACRAYQEADGLPIRECMSGSQPAACRTPDGQLWFPTTKGFVHLKPSELKPNAVPPPVAIESVLVEGRSVTINSLRAPCPPALVIPPRKGRLEIHYTSLNLAAPDRARFRYRMSGYEDEWTDAGTRRIAPYPKLDPGTFAFEVTACNEDGVWSETPATLAITVQPPFWRTWWFMSASALTLLGAIVGTVHLVSTQQLKRQLRQQQALEKERSRIARDLHDQLGANLTQISLLGELAEADKDLPEEVESHARQITQTSRETTRAFDEIVWATNPANDTLEGLINYVCKYAQEYLALADLRYRLDVPSPLPAVPLLPEVRHNVFLAAKEAVNNVVKHAQAQSAWVRLRLDSTRFTLEIQDDGRGLPEAVGSSTRNGLKNMRKRLEDVGGSFTIAPAPAHGTIVSLTVPLRISDFGLRTSP